jgi:hypothetical protein
MEGPSGIEAQFSTKIQILFHKNKIWSIFEK